MKFVLSLFLASFSLLAFPLFSCESEGDAVIWKNAYRGNFSIVHKLVASRDTESINDELMNQFMMAYVYYRMGQNEEIERIFKGIDSYIELVLMINEK